MSENCKTSYNGDVTETACNGDVTKTACNDDVTKTSSNGYVTKTACNGDVTKTPINGYVTKSACNGDATKTSCKGYVTNGEVSDDVTNTSCNGDVNYDVTKTSYNGDVNSNVVDPEERWLPIFQVDAFTDRPFSGNPAAVCLVEDGDLNDDVQQKIAAEMNLSETAYIRKLSSNDDFSTGSRFGLRWFTPTKEIDLCGHATLASAAALFYIMDNPSPQLTFLTRSGELFAKRQGDYISLDLPENVPEPQDREAYSRLLRVNTETFKSSHLNPEQSFVFLTYISFTLLQAVKCKCILSFSFKSTTECLRCLVVFHAMSSAIVGTTPVQEVRYCSSVGGDLLVRLADDTTRSTLESLSPDVGAMMAAHTEGKLRGVAVTVKGSPSNGCVNDNGVKYDFISRFFSPWYGVAEDPVCGSAHTVLASYWAKELGKTDFYVRQCSPRGGDLKVWLRGDGRVEVAGKATVVLNGKIKI
ncbi:phenazine biosynthesis-like domain-containing protein [Branchiostoma floridae]|uniref:Phenazine biosynthesis-like domain-containing protein n=1 Tax=Branchiostoma floridae TaxID=7739 RepID=A0A9J7LVC8_BRAFL|nr:phenazine biosynthesis-like domain-containing protein [Branchiostoma floridae]